MAAEDDQPEQQERKDRQGREQAAALDKVTDNVRCAALRAALLRRCAAAHRLQPPAAAGPVSA